MRVLNKTCNELSRIIKLLLIHIQTTLLYLQRNIYHSPFFVSLFMCLFVIIYLPSHYNVNSIRIGILSVLLNAVSPALWIVFVYTSFSGHMLVSQQMLTEYLNKSSTFPFVPQVKKRLLTFLLRHEQLKECCFVSLDVSPWMSHVTALHLNLPGKSKTVEAMS